MRYGDPPCRQEEPKATTARQRVPAGLEAASSQPTATGCHISVTLTPADEQTAGEWIAGAE